MKRLRALLRDRFAAGILAGLSGWLLAVNLFVAALSCGMTVPVMAADAFVLCEPATFDASATTAPGESEPQHFSHDCPFAIGHDGDALALADKAPGADLGPAFPRSEPLRSTLKTPAFAPIDPGRLGLAPSPRGPPLLSA